MTQPVATDEKKKRRNPEVFADDCRKCGSTNTRVTHTLKIVRYCQCQDCRYKWRQTPKVS